MNIAIECENACNDYNKAIRTIEQPNAPMHIGPILKRDNAHKILKSHDLLSYNLPLQSAFPQLYEFMLKIKQVEERKKTYEEEKKKKEASFEYQLEMKENELKKTDAAITSNIREIAYLEAKLAEAKKQQVLLTDLFIKKTNELSEFKASRF